MHKLWCVQNFSKWTEYFMKSCGIENPRARTNIQRISTFCMNHLKSMQGPPLPSLLPTTNRASMVPPLSTSTTGIRDTLGSSCLGIVEWGSGQHLVLNNILILLSYYRYLLTQNIIFQTSFL